MTAAALLRIRGWRRVDAWHHTEVAPCGEPGALAWSHWGGPHRDQAARPAIADCLAAAAGPSWLLTVWEPLITKAPGPHLAQAFCCYIRTVVFYGASYVVWPYPRLYSSHGRIRADSEPTFLQWDQIDTRLARDDMVEHAGELWACEGGRVLWARLDRSGERRRWWMRHSFRRVRT